MSLATDLATGLEAFSAVSYPDRSTTNPADKTPKWIAQMAGAGVTEWLHNRSDWQLWAHDPNIAENIRYAEGEQDTNQYTRIKTGNGITATSIEVTNRDGSFEDVVDDNGNVEQLYMGRHGGGSGTAKDPMGLDSIIRAKPLPILPVKLRGLKSTVMQQGYEATITALGKKAKLEAQEHEALARLWMDNGAAFKDAGLAPPPELPDPMPETEAEMRTYLDNWQVAAAADLERKVKICWIESGGNQAMSEVADDILRHGYGGLMDIQLPGRRVQSERILPHQGMFFPSAYPDYRDMEQGGRWRRVPVAHVLAEGDRYNRYTVNAEGKAWNNDDRALLKRLAQQGLPENMSTTEALMSDAGGSGTVRVVHWYFRTDDTWSQESFRDKNGYPKKKKAAYDQEEPSQEGGKITRKVINCLYEATIVIGTGLCYNCRKVLEQGRDLHNPVKARMPFSLFSAGLVQGKPVSITRNAKGIIDEIERSYRAYMGIKRTYTPKGSNIPPDLLGIMARAMKIGDSSEAAAYEFIKQTGDSFFPREDPEKPGIPLVNPITDNPFGMPPEAAMHLKDVFDQLQLLEMVTGANAVVSAATPTGDAQGKGVNQIALQGAANVMSFLRDGLKLIYESHARNVAGRIWLTEKDVPVVGVVRELDGTSRQVGPRPDLHEYEFFMQVDLGPTAEEKALFKQNAFQASQGGVAAQITVGDYMHICWLIEGNLKTAQRYMVTAVERKARKDEEKALKMQQANADAQTQTGQAVAKANQETDAKRHELTMAELQFSRETSLMVTQEQIAGQDRNSKRAADARVETARIMEMGDAVQADAKHQHEKENAVLTAALTPPPPAPAAA